VRSTVVQDLLTQHYDPVYLQSMQRNFAQYGARRGIAGTARPHDAAMRCNAWTRWRSRWSVVTGA
jgi:hypothetical protein